MTTSTMSTLPSSQPRRAATSAADSTGLWWWIRSLLSWIVVLVVFALLAVMVVIPKVSGATAYTILTGSMKPGLPPGTLIVVRPPVIEELGVGDVITYQLVSGRPEVVTHRVISVGYSAKGERTFVTQGDNNDARDPEAIRAVQVRGKLWYSVPKVGYLNSWLTGNARVVILIIVVSALLGYALIMFIGAGRDTYRRRKAQSAGDQS